MESKRLEREHPLSITNSWKFFLKNCHWIHYTYNKTKTQFWNLLDYDYYNDNNNNSNKLANINCCLMKRMISREKTLCANVIYKMSKMTASALLNLNSVLFTRSQKAY